MEGRPSCDCRPTSDRYRRMRFHTDVSLSATQDCRIAGNPTEDENLPGEQDQSPPPRLRVMPLQSIARIEHWRLVARPPSLAAGGLHLWKIRTGDEGACIFELAPLLSHREAERAERLRLRHHRERYVRAHAVLRSILSNYINIEPQQIVFCLGYAGKPRIEGPATNLEFNLTTSGDLALLGVCSGEPLGVDCEQVRERKDFAGIARRMFKPEEAARIAAAAQQDQIRLFHLAWTGLEAKVKADGRGLFHRKAPVARGAPGIAHCVPEPGFIAAVARRDLPPFEQWITLELARG